jgi:hypothetical protein
MRSPIHKALVGFLFFAALGCCGGADDAQNSANNVWGGFIKTTGCFDSSGRFTAEPMVSVSNY